MTSREFFIATIVDEQPRFNRVLTALPVDKLDYRPDPKSRTALELISSMAAETSTFKKFLTTGEVDFAKDTKTDSKTLGDITSALDTFLLEAKDTAASLSEVDWDAKAVMLNEGKTEWETTRGNMAWGLVLDLIHHRGQLSTYIRPMGGKVPSIYGPSGDTQ